MTKKVTLQPNQRTKATKRSVSETSDHVSAKRKKEEADDEEAVDYGEVETERSDVQVAVPMPSAGHNMDIQIDRGNPEEAERSRIHSALESWCKTNVSVEDGDLEGDDRVAALAEVGMLLVFEQEKYPDADSMRAELEDIGAIIGGDQVVKKYINFLLSLQNQMKKSRLMAERQHRQHQSNYNRPAPQHMGFPMHPMPFPMMMPPMGGPPGMFGHPHMFPPPPGGPFGMMAPRPGPPGIGQRGNMTLNATGEMSAVQKQKEKDRKRKDILNECTEHLKALLERASKAGSPEEKAKIFELIDKVKKRIDSLREAPTQPPMGATKTAPPVSKPGIRGYFSNQYVNPSVIAATNAGGEQPSIPEPAANQDRT